MADFFKCSDGQIIRVDQVNHGHTSLNHGIAYFEFIDHPYSKASVVCSDNKAAQAEIDRFYEHCK